MRPLGVEWIHAERQTEVRTDKHDKVNNRFSQFFERA